MNLVTAVLVEAALALGLNDEEMIKAHRRALLEDLRPQIHSAFKEIDSDSSGIINKEEIMRASEHLPEILSKDIKPEQVLEFFETLDVDGSGEVEEQEFVDGVVQILLSEVPIETQQTMKLLRLIRVKVLDIEDGMTRVESRMEGTKPRVTRRERTRRAKESGTSAVSRG